MQTHHSIAHTSRDNSQIRDDDSHIPIRVFLLSDHRLLREALARSLESQAAISLVGTQESSFSIAVEIIDSTCDVLLVDSDNMTELDAYALDCLQQAFSDLRVVKIDREAKIADIISAILPVSRPPKLLSHAQPKGQAEDDGKS